MTRTGLQGQHIELLGTPNAFWAISETMLLRKALDAFVLVIVNAWAIAIMAGAVVVPLIANRGFLFGLLLGWPFVVVIGCALAFLSRAIHGLMLD